MTPRYDVAIVGGGIVGLAHAWMAARRNLNVIVLERTSVAQGASVRNFGMIWPVGQPAGELHAIALKARDFWLQLHADGVVDVETCGSLHLAHRSDEMAVLEEFRDQQTHDVTLMTPEQACRRSELVNAENLLGAMYSSTELRVDPRTASRRIATWLAARHRVDICFNTAVTRIEGDRLFAADGRTWQADRIVVCSGSDLQTLYGDVLRASGLTLCKLQMLKSVAQKNMQPAAPHIASGLTLRHYTSFNSCPSHTRLRHRIASETPELDRYGIHVMASGFANGEVILGDSHEYGADVTPFDKSRIDELILRELRRVICLQNWEISERWHGIYAKHPSLPVYQTRTRDGIEIFVGTGGAGMTMSFGLADRAWKQWSGEN